MKKTVIYGLIVLIILLPVMASWGMIWETDTDDTSSDWQNPTQSNSRCQQIHVPYDFRKLMVEIEFTSESTVSSGNCWMNIYEDNGGVSAFVQSSVENVSCTDLDTDGYIKWTFNNGTVFNAVDYWLCAMGNPDVATKARFDYSGPFPYGYYCSELDNGTVGAGNVGVSFRLWLDNETVGPSDSSITLNAPANNTYNNSASIQFRYTPSVVNPPLLNCSLIINYTGTMQANQTNTSAITNGSVNTFTMTGMTDGTYLWGVECYDTTHFASENYTIKIDNIDPVLTINNPNNVSYYRKTDTLPISLVCQDETVYILNYTTYNTTHLVASQQNTTTSGTTLKLSNNTPLTNYGEGIYSMNISCSDGHTDNDWNPLLEYEYVTDGVILDVDGKEKIDIKIKDIVGGSLDKLKPIKLKDRIIFNLTFDATISSFTYEIKADKYVRYYSDYGGHYILNDRYWWDTEPYTPDLIEEKNGKLYLTISDLNTDTIITESIGGLNIFETYYMFYVDATPPYFSPIAVNSSHIVYYNRINVSVLINESNAHSWRFAWNNSGIYVNASYYQYANRQNVSVDVQVTTAGSVCMQFWANDSAANVNTTQSCYTSYYWYEPSYRVSENEGERTTFSINFVNITNTTLNVTMTYNNTLKYPYPVTYLGDNIWQYNYTLNASTISALRENVTLYWTYNYTYTNGTLLSYDNTSFYNQSISKGQLLECGGISNYTTLNITFYHEDTLKRLNVDGEMLFTLWINDPNVATNYTFNFSNRNNYSICIYPSDINFLTNAYIKYTHDTGFTHRYYMRSANLSGTKRDLYLYNFNTTNGVSDLKGEIRDEDTYAYFQEVYASLLRYYPITNSWVVVQMDKSDDFGQIFFNVKEESEDYKIVFNHELQNIYTTNQLKFICTSGVCQLIFLMSPYDASTDSVTPPYTYSYNNATGIVTLSWNDPSGLVDEVRLMVLKNSYNGFNTICDTSLASAIGSLTCNISQYSGIFTVRGYYSSSPESPFIMEYIEKITTALRTIRGYSRHDGGIWSLGLSVTITFFGIIISPFAAVFAFLFSLVIIYALGLSPLVTLPFITVAMVLAFVIGSRIRS